MTMLYHNNLGYSALNTARASLSALGFAIDGHSVGSHPFVIRFMKGVFNLRPPAPRHDYVWDVSIVLRYLRKLSPVKYLSLKELTCKLCMLICLTCAARVQTVHALKLNCMQKKKSSFIFNFNSLLKTCRPGFRRPNIVLKAYPADRRLCVYTVLVEYLKRTLPLRSDNDDALFISYVKPHNAASKDTLSRWIRYIMTQSGIDMNVISPHSVRAASVSKAFFNSVPVHEILSKVGWTNERTFAKFYNKPIVSAETNFVNSVMTE